MTHCKISLWANNSIFPKTSPISCGTQCWGNICTEWDKSEGKNGPNVWKYAPNGISGKAKREQDNLWGHSTMLKKGSSPRAHFKFCILGAHTHLVRQLVKSLLDSLKQACMLGSTCWNLNFFKSQLWLKHTFCLSIFVLDHTFFGLKYPSLSKTWFKYSVGVS